jgi:HK97 family phage major capsid protein
MATLQALIERRANTWQQMQEIAARAETENRDLTGEERQAWDRAETDITGVEEDIQRLEKFGNRAAEMAKVDRSDLVKIIDADDATDGTRDDRYTKAFAQYIRKGVAEMGAEHVNVLRSGFRTGKDFQNALGVGTSSAGGYTVPPGYREELIQTLKLYGGMLTRGQELRTEAGQDLVWPTLDDTGNVGAILSENTQMTQQDVVFGTQTLSAYMYTSKLVLVSYQLLNDAFTDVDALLRGLLATRLGRIWNQHFTTGTGTSQPQGIVTGASVGKTGLTGQTLTVIYDDLIDLITSVDPAYLNGSEEFMLSNASLAVVRKLKDTQGHPLWQPSIQVGVPNTLVGYPVVINQDMPVMGANAKSVLFGNFTEAYLRRIVNDVQIVRLNERYADFLQVGFFGFARAGGTVQRTGAVKAYQNSAT